MWVVFNKTFYSSRKLIFWFFIGFFLYGILIGAIYPFMVENAENYNEMINSMPKEMLGMFGVDPDEIFDLSNLGTYLHIEMMLWLLITAGAVAIYQAFSAFTNAERDHSMDMLLSLPISRRDNLLGQYLVTVLTVIIALFGGWLGVVVTTPMWEDIDFSMLDMALAIMGAIMPLLVIISLSYLLTAVVPSSKRFAGAIAYVFWIGSYMIYSLVSALEQLYDLKPFFVYHYYNAADLMNKGIDISDWTLLFAVTALLLALAWWKVDDKELGI